ncbi:MAG: trehalose-phosphatase [Acidobacteria bacterium]|nr:MAG: trehalose-phosphatase [Acidobacteriota bacterium]
MKRLLARPQRHVLEAFARRRVLLAFDFDGTLAPLVARAADASMRPRTAKLFNAVAHRYPCVIVTGRRARDIRRRLGNAPVAAVVGNHGADSAINRAAVRRTVAAARRAIAPIVEREPGSWIENKTYSLSVHFRPGPTTDRHLAQLRRAVATVPKTGLVPGKNVLNVVAADAPDKGGAVEQLLRALRCDRVLFVGDDETDERVFRHLPTSRLLGIRIGPAPHSRAAYSLDRQSDIDTLLAMLLALRDDEQTPAAARQEQLGVLGEALEIMRVLWSLDHRLHQRSKRMQRALGITGEQRLAMRLALHAPGLAAGDLAALLHVHPSTLTGMLKRLVANGFMKSRADTGDRRRLRLDVTPKGARVLRESGLSIESAVAATLEETPDSEVAIARSFLERMSAKL